MISFPSLRPKVDKSPSDRSADTLCMYGTVPIHFKGHQYNIPVNIWIPHAFPATPPKVLVVPTETMLVKAGRHVDTSGVVYLPYLHSWQAGRSTLKQLTDEMAGVFGQDPPVYAKPASGSGGSGGGAARAQSQPAQQNYGGNPYGRPAQQPHHQSQPASYGGSYGGGGGGGGGVGAGGGVAGAGAGAAYGAAGAAYGAAGAAAGAAAAGAGAAYGRYAQPSPEQEEELMKQSMISAVSEKVQRRLREYNAMATPEIEKLMATRAKLVAGDQTLTNMLQRLDTEKQQVQDNINLLTTKNTEIEEAIRQMEAQKEVDPDEAVVSTTPLYTQLFEMVAEENALEDAVYHLGKALNNGVLDLPTYLKYVRILSRREFLKRATIQKARHKAGLDSHHTANYRDQAQRRY